MIQQDFFESISPWMMQAKHRNKTRKLQKTLEACAKQNKTRKFHQLFDRIYRSDTLWSAWCIVKENERGYVDEAQKKQTVETYEAARQRVIKEYSEQDDSINGSKPLRSETNRTSSATDSSR